MTAFEISSASNPRIKRLIGLRDRRHRDRESVFLVEGAKELERATAAGHRPLEVYFDPSRYDRSPHRAPLEVKVAASALDRASYRGRSQGVIAVFSQFDVTLDHLEPGPEPLVLLAEAVEKPGNLGALLRIADAVGADGLISADPSIDPFSPNVVRASTGALFTVPLAVADLAAAVGWLRRHEVRIVAADPDSTLDVWSADLTGPLALMVGSEHHGLSASASAAADISVAIPMFGGGDSLNVSVAMAVVAYEALRQRRRG